MGDASRVADVVIIGGGIMGCTTAYYLAKAGIDVVLLEKDAIACEASGRNRGNVRLQLRHPLELPIAIDAIRRWRQMDDELGMATEYRTLGNLLVTYREEEVEGLLEEVQRQRSRGLNANLLQGKELRELAPGLSDAIVAGMYSTEDGHVNPLRATVAFATAAKRAGARVLTGVRAESIQVEGGRVRGVRTSDGDFAGGMVLNAAGVRSPELCRPLGVDIPVVPARHQVLVSTRVPALNLPYLRCTGPRVSFGQTADGSLLLGMGPAERVGFDPSLTSARIARTMRELARLVPALREVRVVRGWTGWFEMSPDDLPIMGPVDGIEGLIIAAGFSGHGFAPAPAYGVLLSELMLNGKTSLPIDGFRPSRFTDSGGFEKVEFTGKLASLSNLTAEISH